MKKVGLLSRNLGRELWRLGIFDKFFTVLPKSSPKSVKVRANHELTLINTNVLEGGRERELSNLYRRSSPRAALAPPGFIGVYSCPFVVSNRLGEEQGCCFPLANVPRR
jgi:hypothetical protein